MKYSFLLVTALCLINLVSCKKKEKDESVNYTISNIRDLNLKNNESLVWDLETDLISGNQEKVTLSISGLPNNVTATPTNITGIVPFKANFTINALFATPGTYPLVISATTAANKTKTYDINLAVLNSGDCSSLFFGNYSHSVSVKNGSSNGTFNAIITASATHSMTISGLKCFSSPSATFCNANFNCDDGTIDIPSQTPYGESISGTGFKKNGVIVLTYTYKQNIYTPTINYADTLR